jgi:Zn-dependent protease with chaperone function
MSTSLAPRPRRAFPEIAPVSWEHPADRAALQALRSVPGFEDVVRKILAVLGGERGIRLIFQGNAVRVGPEQFPRAWAIHVEVCSTFDWPRIPELYITQTPIFNAGAYGVDEPFVVLNSAALEMLNEEEIRALIAHEMGHVVSGHAFYRTIAAILALVSLGSLPFLAGLAILPVKLAFLEWSRKSELSSDRAGLLGGQDVIASQQLLMKMAGGGREIGFNDQMNVQAFMAQAHEYTNTNDGLASVYKIINTLGLTHPMNTVRAAELQQWVAAGDYDRILRGEYTRRGQEAKDRHVRDEMADAGNYSASEARETASKMAQAAREAASRVGEAFRKGSGRSTP